jgi:thioredoxin reductase (NADPH)
MQRYDLIIVGAGPVGLAAGIEAKRAGLTYLILEAGTICQSLLEYPTGMRFFSPADELAIAGYPFPTPHDEKPSREMAINYYRKLASAEDLNVNTYERVQAIECVEAGFRLHTLHLPFRQPENKYDTRYVLLCTGVWEHPRRLQMPGADLPHVLYRWQDPIQFWHKRVLVVGSGNSAGEAAIRLCDSGATVFLAVEPANLGQCRFRPFVLREILMRTEAGAITPMTQATIQRVTPTHVFMQAQGIPHELAVDFVLAQLGLEADKSLLEPLNIDFGSDGKPLHDPDTFETSVSGLFVAGAISRQGFIFLGREHVKGIVAKIRDAVGRK